MKEQLLKAPQENFSRGLFEVDIPELGPKIQGKVRDMWIVDNKRVIVTTDRQSAFDKIICTIPGKGAVLNGLSGWWFSANKDSIPTHYIFCPHPNVMITKEAKIKIPVEVVFRRYMAKSSTRTSVYYNYAELGRRTIYGVDFPDGLGANCEFPQGTILTPTTKAETGHDEELTDEQAQELVDKVAGIGTWQKIKEIGFRFFEHAYYYHQRAGLILVDTKFEFGLDSQGNLMLIDEVFTPDSSRLWLLETYNQRFQAQQNPETFDKEILRRWLAENSFTGDGQVQVVPSEVIEKMSQAYKLPYQMITGQNILDEQTDTGEIRQAIFEYLST